MAPLRGTPGDALQTFFKANPNPRPKLNLRAHLYPYPQP